MEQYNQENSNGAQAIYIRAIAVGSIRSHN